MSAFNSQLSMLPLAITTYFSASRAAKSNLCRIASNIELQSKASSIPA